MVAADQLAGSVGVKTACEAVGVPRASLYRQRLPRMAPAPRPISPRALCPQERQQVLETLNDERLRRPASGAGPCQLARRRHLPLLAADHVSRARRERAGSGAAR